MTTGIWLHESGILGASPDGIAEIDDSKVVIEVKCPYSARKMSVAEAATSLKGFFLSTLILTMLILHSKTSLT